jgi:hypothetical protein
MKMNRFQNGSPGSASEKVGNLSGVRNRKNCSVQIGPNRGRSRKTLAAARETTTTIAARVDVGFGNSLFIRGQGEGLSWDKGQPLVCVDGANWVWSRRPATEPVIFKLLINDQLWCRGENFQVGAGCQLEVAPGF